MHFFMYGIDIKEIKTPWQNKKHKCKIYNTNTIQQWYLNSFKYKDNLKIMKLYKKNKYNYPNYYFNELLKNREDFLKSKNINIFEYYYDYKHPFLCFKQIQTDHFFNINDLVISKNEENEFNDFIKQHLNPLNKTDLTLLKKQWLVSNDEGY